MSEKLPQPEVPPEVRRERQELEARLTMLDRDPALLADFMEELYGNYPDNPHVFYMAATRLTSLAYLDVRNQDDELVLPEPYKAHQAFLDYTSFMDMLHQESGRPLYANNVYVKQHLAGAREELALHGIFAFGRANGAEIVANPSSARRDYFGREGAADMQLYMPPQTRAIASLQIKRNFERAARVQYRPGIFIIGLESALGRDQAYELRDTLRHIGNGRINSSQQTISEKEHKVISDAFSGIINELNTQADELAKAS